MDISVCRGAITRALQILRHTPTEKLDEIHEILYGHKIGNARMKIHAGVYESMFADILSDIDERCTSLQEAVDRHPDSDQ